MWDGGGGGGVEDTDLKLFTSSILGSWLCKLFSIIFYWYTGRNSTVNYFLLLYMGTQLCKVLSPFMFADTALKINLYLQTQL